MSPEVPVASAHSLSVPLSVFGASLALQSGLPFQPQESPSYPPDEPYQPLMLKALEQQSPIVYTSGTGE